MYGNSCVSCSQVSDFRNRHQNWAFQRMIVFSILYILYSRWYWSEAVLALLIQVNGDGLSWPCCSQKRGLRSTVASAFHIHIHIKLLYISALFADFFCMCLLVHTRWMLKSCIRAILKSLQIIISNDVCARLNYRFLPLPRELFKETIFRLN